MDNFDDGLSEQRCAHCQQLVPTTTIVQVPSIGQICERCDAELTEEQDFLGLDRETYLNGGTPWTGGRS